MPVIKSLKVRVYCGPKFEKLWLKKGESMMIRPEQISFFQKLLDSNDMVLLDKPSALELSNDSTLVESVSPAPVHCPVVTMHEMAPAKKENKPVTGIELPKINLKKNKFKHKGKRK